MKHLLQTTIGIIACLIAITSCNDNEDFTGFEIDKNDITIGAEGGTDKVIIKSSEEWVAIASEPWIMVSPANGIGTAECMIVIDSTLTNEMREATIRFTPDGMSPQMVTIHQTGFDKSITIKYPEVEIEASAKKNERYFDAQITTNVPFKVNVEYTTGDATEWLTPKSTKVNLDRGARPRTTNIRFDWRANTYPEARIAEIHFVPTDPTVELKNPAVLTLTQKAAPRIEDNRAGDSLALLTIQERLNIMGNSWDPSENMRNWNNVGLWESTDKDLPCPEAVGRVRYVTYAMFNYDETFPQEIKYLKYLDSLNISSNTNTMLKSLELGTEICGLEYLRKLVIFSFGLVSLPDEFAQLGNTLEYLNLTANNFNAIPPVLTKENFPKLKSLLLMANRRWSTSDLRKAGNYENGLGLHIDINQNNSLKKLFLWDTLEELRLSNNYMEGELPEFEVGKDGVLPYTQADVEAFGGDTIQYLADNNMPKILPNMKLLSINLNFFTGNLPKWILYHPHLLDWVPELLIFNQHENGINTEGQLVKFANEPTTFDYYYEAFPGTREKYELKEEITEE